MTSSASSAQTNEGAGIDEAAFALAIVVFLFHIFFVGKLYFARNRGGNARKSAKTDQPQSILSIFQLMQNVEVQNKRIEFLEKGALTTQEAVDRWRHPFVDDDGEGTSTLFPPLPVRMNTVGSAVIRTAEANTISAEARLKEDAAKATALAHAKRDQRMTQAGMDAVTQALEFGPVGGAEPAALPIAKHGSSRVHPVG